MRDDEFRRAWQSRNAARTKRAQRYGIAMSNPTLTESDFSLSCVIV